MFLVRFSAGLKVSEYVAFGLRRANCEITFRSQYTVCPN